MLNIKDDQLVIEAKGIYSIEQFLIARRLMYWQVYFHKTAVAAEKMLNKIILRAKELAKGGAELFASPALRYFLYNEVGSAQFRESDEALAHFALLDDSDITSAIKVWASHHDIVLSTLSKNFTNRQLFKIKISEEVITEEEIEKDLQKYSQRFGISKSEAGYFISPNTISSNTYNAKDENINILFNDGTTKNIFVVSDILDPSALTRKIQKHYYCYLKL
jgi:HD superfamily phosphohydrolase